MSLKNEFKKVLPRIVDMAVDAIFNAAETRVLESDEEELVSHVGQESRPERGGTPSGEGDLEYCIECCVKHSQTAKILMTEALQRAEADGPGSEGVQEKVRGVVEQLCGLEDDSNTVNNERVSTLNALTRGLRKFIYVSDAEVGGASMEELRRTKVMVDQLVDAVYMVRSSEGGCPACDAEEICGGNLECVEFLAEASKKVKSKQEWKGFLEEAGLKFKRRE